MLHHEGEDVGKFISDSLFNIEQRGSFACRRTILNYDMVYTFSQKILFKHCDPAGIVFYPRYFEMINDCIETFFSDCLNWSFDTMHPQAGVPTASIGVDFTAPSRHGDQLVLTLTVVKLGQTSIAFDIRGKCEDEIRFVAKSTLVHTEADGCPRPWPVSARQKITEYMEGSV